MTARLGRFGASTRTVAAVVIILAVVIAAIAARFVAPYDPLAFDIVHRFAAPGGQHLLGTDSFGRDILSRLIYGARASLEVALGSAVLAMLVGVALGLFGGYFAGVVEIVTVRLADVIVAFPPIVLALLVVTLLGPGIITLIYVIAIVYVPTFARITYGEVLAAKRMEYVEAAQALGAGARRIIYRTILPNVMAPIIVQFSLTISAAILLESGLSFLGLGVVPPTPSWGQMIADGRTYMQQDPWMLLWPCLTIVVTILAFNTLGDALRDRLDPRARGRAGMVRGRGSVAGADEGVAIVADSPVPHPN